MNKHQIKGTFFVVPCPAATPDKVIGDDQAVVNLIKQAMADGHEAHQHSVTHMCIENGTADMRMFDLMGDEARIDYATSRFVYEKLWELENIQAHINWGRQAWIEAFGEPSRGYRPVPHASAGGSR